MRIAGKQVEQLLFIVALSCIGLLAIDQLVAPPLVRFWQSRAQQIDELRQKVDQGARLLKWEKSINDTWDAMLKSSLPPQASITETRVFNSVNDWAQKSGLAITSVKPLWIDEKECRKLEIRLSASGSMDATARFLYTLEADPQADRIEGLTMTSRDDQGQQLSLDLRFTALVIEEAKP